MNQPAFTCITVEDHHPWCAIKLNRPDVANAMSLKMVEELTTCFEWLVERSFRCLILEGAGKNFCAGADINDVKNAKGDNHYLQQLNRAFGHMIQEADRLPMPLICCLHGAVMGGGFGLACVSDLAIAMHGTRFALPETSLGLIPAQIAPFVVKRIGLTQARRLALFGERINAEEALEIGIIHHLSHSLDDQVAQVEKAVNAVLKCAPQATAATKQLLHEVQDSSGLDALNQILDKAAIDFADAASGEGRQGAAAFMEKRAALWVQPVENFKQIIKERHH
ncbi:putative enoyl-CoA hydratase [BD1-7 clade bacterium]|uniref:Putative enoyl-CoA hydratase n=1 Tax=BD1-7 clade bacterium TaxID=2029982 RepID=A0A5S9NTR3_9GAMM|nr:putative enoyl-CoA hydratase [BD1-7 clade bacterium]